MVEKVFLQILNMSFTASFVIILVLLARLFLKKSPKVLSYALWGVVLFRLICPFSFESMFSLLPVKSNPIPLDIVYKAAPTIDTGIPAINHTINQSLPAATPAASINPLQIWTFIGSAVWLMGMAILVIYSILSLMKLQKRLKNAIHEKDNIYLAEHLDTPFVMGIIRPKIYLPASLTEVEKRYILLHEQMHIKRFDHVIKILSFFILCLHWFNPLVWIAFFVSGKDMEMSCDEAVIKQLGSNVKKEYSSSLLTLATGRRIIAGSPLAFGEGDTKGRIKNLLNYKKPAFWMVTLSLILCIILAGCLLSNPKTHSNASDFSIKTDDLVVELGSADILPLDKLGAQEIVNEMTGEITVVEDYSGFSITRDSQQKIIHMEILSDSVYTYRNITIGNTRDDLLSAYPELIPEEQKLKALWFEDQKSIIEFYFLDDYDIVSAIKIYSKVSNDDLPMPAVSLEELWSARTKYVGDNSAVGKIISLLQFPEGVIYDGFELYTRERPYAVTVKFKTDTETRNFYSGSDNQFPFQINALIMLSLIENVEYITFSLDDDIYDPYSIQYTTDMAKMVLGDNYRKDSETLDGFRSQIERLQELLSFHGSTEHKALDGTIKLDDINSEYRAEWKESYKYNSPILIDSYIDLMEFLKKHPSQSTSEDIILEKYDKDFFKQGIIYAYVKSEGSGSVSLSAKKAELTRDKLRLYMERIDPGEGTTDMATRVCLFGIKRNDVKNIKSVEGIIMDKSGA